MFAKKEYKQLEFFEELTKSPTKKFKRFKLPSMGEEKIVLKVSYEKIVLAGIAFVLVLTLIFSLGVERGKSLKQFRVQPQVISMVEVPEKKEVQFRKEDIDSIDIQGAKKNSLKSKFHTIQVVAYKNLAPALKEKEKIKKKGLEPFIIKGSKGWILVCVGSFADLSSAKKQLLVLRKIYSDCFIKEVKRKDLYNE